MSKPAPGPTVPMPEGGRFGRFRLLVAERRLLLDDQPVPLGSRAFDLLAALAARRDRVVPKDELIEVVWPGLIVEDNNLQVQISALRKVLGTQAIATVPGRGYQFTVAVFAKAGVPGDPAPAVETKPAAAAAASPRPAERNAAATGRSRLLVADDNKVNRLLLCRSLELMGHEVQSAENGRAALDLLRGGRFDLLLLDLEMPELDGFGLLEQRAQEPAMRELPVIVTSSLEGVAAVARCIELGADDYLHKPVNPVLLKARVEASLERKHLRDRQRELLARLAPELADGAIASSGMPEGRRGEATVLVARLQGLDAVVAAQPVAETLELMSNWTTLMVDAIEGHGGLVHRLSGDSISAVFGLAEPLPGEGGAPAAAVRAAREMAELASAFNAERAASGKVPMQAGVGLATGEVVAGHAGTPKRGGYACVGAAAERAAALQGMAASGAVLLDAPTLAALGGQVEASSLPSAVLPGDAGPVAVHGLAMPG